MNIPEPRPSRSNTEIGKHFYACFVGYQNNYHYICSETKRQNHNHGINRDSYSCIRL